LREELRALRSALEKSEGKNAPRRKLPVPSRQTARTSALMSVAGTLRRPRVLGAVFLITLAVALLIVWGTARRFRASSAEPG
jgi:hypothetical protein